MKDKEKITVYGLSDMGRQRTNNEDAYIAERLDDHTVLAVAIDGVGGYEGGEVAAEIAKTEIPKYLHEFQNGERIELLKQAVICANNAIYEHRQTDPARSNMSCVLTSALIDKDRKVVDMVHVGDTRMYQFRHGILRKLSHDHSLIGYREEIGDLTEEQAMHHPQRNVISRDVGSAMHEVADRDFLESEEFPLLPNSTFLLCSDGLTDLITSKQIVTILKQRISLQKKAKELIDAANEAGGKDNITVVLVEYQAEEENEPVSELTKKNPVHPVEDNNDGVVVSKDGEKRKNDKLIVGILCGIIVLLLGACAALGLFSMKKYNQVLVLKKGMAMIDQSINDSVVNLADLLQKIDTYTQAAQNNNLDLLSQMYADTARSISYTNLSKEKVMDLYSRFDSQQEAIEKHLSVRENTLTTKRLPNGEVFVDYVEDFKGVKQDSTELSFVVHRIVTFDKEGKIVSVLEDLLQSSEKLATK